MERSQKNREKLARNIKLNISAHGLENEPAAKVLWIILDNYVQNAVVCNTELKFKNKYDIPRKFIVKLNNNKHIDDVVLIRNIE